VVLTCPWDDWACFWHTSTSIQGWIFVSARNRASSRFKWFLWFVSIDVRCFLLPHKMSSHSPEVNRTPGWRQLPYLQLQETTSFHLFMRSPIPQWPLVLKFSNIFRIISLVILKLSQQEFASCLRAFSVQLDIITYRWKSALPSWSNTVHPAAARSNLISADYRHCHYLIKFQLHIL
jgi:hypothetical protein